MKDIFKPYTARGLSLRNRIVMAPMTRSRAPDDVANEFTALYYTQRATAGLIISEGTPISREGQGYLFNPGMYLSAQIEGWRLTTDSVHAAGGKIFAQLWHVGRVSHTSIQADGAAPVSATGKIAEGASAFGFDADGKPGFVPVSPPRALSTKEVKRVVQDFANAAANAIAAGFDGVEVHAANGYLFEQFFNPLVNDRQDEYSNTLENRIRFAVEVVDAIVGRIGAQRVGIRISPYGQLFDMPAYPDVAETYEVLGRELAKRQIAYVHIMDQTDFFMAPKDAGTSETGLEVLLKRLRAAIGDTPLMLAGALTKDRAQDLVDAGLIDLAAFGKPFIANPDLFDRLYHGHPLSEPVKETFYGGGAEGYVDYPPYRPV